MPINHLLPFALPRGRDRHHRRSADRLLLPAAQGAGPIGSLRRVGRLARDPVRAQPRRPGQRGCRPAHPGRHRGLVRGVAGRLLSAYAGRAAPVRRLLRYAAAADGVLGLLRADPGALPRDGPAAPERPARRGRPDRAGHRRRAGPGTATARTTAWPGRPHTGRRCPTRWTSTNRSSHPTSTSTPRSACSATIRSCCAISAWPWTWRSADLPANPTQVSVSTGFGGGQALEVELVTRTTADFLARPNPDPDHNEQAGGFLRLAAEKAFLSIVDPHLAASRVGAAADAVVGEDSGVLPALATRALSLVRPDLTKTFLNRTERQAELEDELQDNLTAGGPPVVLFAEDMTIGQRFDVLDQGVWRSLFERRSDIGYTFPRATGLAIVPGPDEGWNTTMLVTEQSDVRPEPNPDTDQPITPTALFRLDDAVYRWSGWSGAAPAPGGVLDGATGAPAKLSPNEPAADQAGPGSGRLRRGAGQPAAAAVRPDLRDAGPVRRPGRELTAAVGEGGRGRRCRRRRPSAGWSRSRRPWWSGVRRARCRGWATPPWCWCCAATSTYPTRRSPRSTGCCSRVGSGRTCASCTGCRPAGPTRTATPSWSCGTRWT